MEETNAIMHNCADALLSLVFEKICVIHITKHNGQLIFNCGKNEIKNKSMLNILFII